MERLVWKVAIRKLMWNVAMEHYCGTLHCCGTLLWDVAVGRSVLSVFCVVAVVCG